MPRFLSAFGGLIIDLTETLVIGFSFSWLCIFFMQPHQVNGHSMDPNFQTGGMYWQTKSATVFANQSVAR